MNDVHKRLLFVAKHRLKNNFDAYERFQFEIENSPTGQDYLLRAQLGLGSLIGQNKAILGVQATNEINQKLAEIVDLWLSRQKGSNVIKPATGLLVKKETAEQRQARRYQMCIDAGLLMPKNNFSHLPRGVGKLAKKEGISTASFSQDVKKHICRINAHL